MSSGKKTAKQNQFDAYLTELDVRGIEKEDREIQQDVNYTIFVDTLASDIVQDVAQHRYSHNTRHHDAIVNFIRHICNALYLVDLEANTIEPMVYMNGKATIVHSTLMVDKSYDENIEGYVATYLHPDDRKRILSAFDRKRLNSVIESTGHFVVRYRRLYGDSFGYEEVHVTQLDDAVSSKVAIIVSNASKVVREEMRQHDIMQSALNAAQNASHAKDMFLATMSHDLRTPMNSIISLTEIAQEHFDDHEKVSDCLEKVSRSAKQLMGLINDLLDVSRIEAGKMVLEEQPVNIFVLMRDLEGLFQSSVEQNRINLTIDTSSVTIPQVYGDLIRLNQIFMNIVGNAIKFTPADGSVLVKVEHDEAEKRGYLAYRFTISDTGRGMSEKFLERIFEPYERERRTLDNIEGTGLGMTITKHLVDLMGGSISVYSLEGVGSSFIINLDMRKQDQATINAQAAKRVRMTNDITSKIVQRHQGERILIVDDDEISRSILHALLTDRGFVVDCASSGQESIDMIADSEVGHYNYVFMDVHMPSMDGYTALRKIRGLKRPDAATIPVIATTADAYPEDRQTALDNGMSGFVSKPLNMNTVMSVLDSLG